MARLVVQTLRPVSDDRIRNRLAPVHGMVGLRRIQRRMRFGETGPQEERTGGIPRFQKVNRLVDRPGRECLRFGDRCHGRIHFILPNAMHHGTAQMRMLLHVAVIVPWQPHGIESISCPFRPEMHLADCMGLISGTSQQPRQGAFGIHRQRIPVLIIGMPVAGRTQPVHDGPSGRNTDRTIRIGTGEGNPVAHQMIHVRRSDTWISQ